MVMFAHEPALQPMDFFQLIVDHFASTQRRNTSFR
jgi:hypothetical protein